MFATQRKIGNNKINWIVELNQYTIHMKAKMKDIINHWKIARMYFDFLLTKRLGKKRKFNKGTKMIFFAIGSFSSVKLFISKSL